MLESPGPTLGAPATADNEQQAENVLAGNAPVGRVPAENVSVENVSFQSMPVGSAPLGSNPGEEAHAACADCQRRPVAGASAVPLPQTSAGGWRPPGIGGPWPENEYLCDGGDYGLPAVARGATEIEGLDIEDTVARYESDDGTVQVQPSNRVCVYAPRFGAIRSVTSVAVNAQVEGLEGVQTPTGIVRFETVDEALSSRQNVRLGLNVGTKLARHYRMRQGDGRLSATLGPEGFASGFAAFEDLAVVRYGKLQASDKARLAAGVEAAITWTHDQAVQVILDNQRATEFAGDQRAYATYTVDEPPPRPKLRLIKMASRQVAEPGETVDFTLRLDNVGNRPLNHVTVIDHLTTRLAYVEGSAQASVATRFSVEQQDDGTLRLRWEVDETLEPGRGGIIRFQCRVR